MKKIALGFVWFVVFWLGALIVGSATAGAIAGAQVSATSMSEGYAKGQLAGQQAGAEFGKKYGGIILIGALVVSIGGTAAGILPGTRAKRPPEKP